MSNIDETQLPATITTNKLERQTRILAELRDESRKSYATFKSYMELYRRTLTYLTYVSSMLFELRDFQLSNPTHIETPEKKKHRGAVYEDTQRLHNVATRTVATLKDKVDDLYQEAMDAQYVVGLQEAEFLRNTL